MPGQGGGGGGPTNLHRQNGTQLFEVVNKSFSLWIILSSTSIYKIDVVLTASSAFHITSHLKTELLRSSESTESAQRALHLLWIIDGPFPTTVP